jgi:hypothetical protein
VGAESASLSRNGGRLLLPAIHFDGNTLLVLGIGIRYRNAIPFDIRQCCALARHQYVMRGILGGLPWKSLSAI